MPRRPAIAVPDRPLPVAEAEPFRPVAQLTPMPALLPAVTPAPTSEPVPAPSASTRPVAPVAAETPIAAAEPVEADAVRAPAPRSPAGPPPPRRETGNGVHPTPETDEGSIERGATAPQLRRFIKSRAYVPMHELRRRFAINSADDDVTPVDLERRRIFVGLPEREGRLLGELLRGGDIGFELSLDPVTPIVVGVYPMRPVTRA